MKTNQSVHYIYRQLNSLFSVLNDEMYSKSIDILGGSSIGQHVRHIYDFYNCIRRSASDEQLDYSCRDRNPDIETSLDFVENLFHQLLSELDEVSSENYINVLSEFSSDENDEREWIKSTIGREIMYAYDHAVHHLAIIKMGVRSQFPNVILPVEMGIAPSTIKYRKESHHH